MDAIQIKDLEVYGRHGATREENVLGQKFLVTLVLFLDTRAAGTEDDLSKTIDYAAVSHLVKKEMEEKCFRLIEAAAENLAELLLCTYPQIERLRVEIKKPWAPILLPLDTVSVRIERSWHTAFLSIGSNMGDREAHLKNGLAALERRPGIRVVRVSDFIETKPYGGVRQDDFLNAAVELGTVLSPGNLLCILHEIEEMEKRTRTVRWGPRTLDMDILFYGDEIVQTDELTIPHRDMHRRLFVLEPLAQIAPWKKHPVFSRTVLELLERLSAGEE